ncbi:MAG: CoA activase, partial [Spirochaetales bacterium]|nr:CoA activase [Spirochaetales bacterium]
KIGKGAYSVCENDSEKPVIGIPAALHLAEDIGFWTTFFASLGYPVVSSGVYKDSVKRGKLIAGAEFCAPMAAFHGHSRFLSSRCDVLFVPIYLEDIHSDSFRSGPDRKTCYYTQFAPSLVKSLEEAGGKPCLAPVVDRRKGVGRMLRELHRFLKEQFDPTVGRDAIEAAYEDARSAKAYAAQELKRIFRERGAPEIGLDVVLLGRPYTVLDDSMSKGIPGILGTLGMRAYYQDMLPENQTEDSTIAELLDVFHWQYASRILGYAEYCAATPGIYPVLLTSFKCSPDSFMMEYFGAMMDRYGKPYLILQLDEHESNVGYETRIEAAVRSFRNHFDLEGSSEAAKNSPLSRGELPTVSTSLEGKTVLFPNWDPVATPLVVANLRWAGFDVRLLEENEKLIRESMKYNTGQCIPVHIVLHEFAEYLKKYDLDPARSILWMIKSKWSCNIPLYPHYIKTMLTAIGGGLEKAEVYSGSIVHEEMSKPVAMRGYFAYLFAGLIRSLSCKIRPYEINEGETDKAANTAVAMSIEAFLGHLRLDDTLSEIIELFEGIAYKPEPRPKAAIFGDIYVRDNDVMNQDLVRFIEKSGGEVVTAPYSDYLRIVSS